MKHHDYTSRHKGSGGERPRHAVIALPPEIVPGLTWSYYPPAPCPRPGTDPRWVELAKIRGMRAARTIVHPDEIAGVVRRFTVAAHREWWRLNEWEVERLALGFLAGLRSVIGLVQAGREADG